MFIFLHGICKGLFKKWAYVFYETGFVIKQISSSGIEMTLHYLCYAFYDDIMDTSICLCEQNVDLQFAAGSLSFCVRSVALYIPLLKCI